MIAYLKGKLIHKQAPQIIIDVSGVGYELLVPMSTYYNLSEINEESSLFCYHYIREDANLLYGFGNLNERKLFIELLKINGVGPRLALTILSNYQVNEFISIVADCNANALVKLPGVGKKTADRLLLELRDKLKTVFQNNSLNNNNDASTVKFIEDSNYIADTTVSDAIAALESLGYKPADARKVVIKLAENNHLNEKVTSEYLIKGALKEFR